jgi:hypothetical protein
MTNSIQSNSTTSPLTEADPHSLNELFERDPLQLKDPEIEFIVHALRRQRVTWEAEEAKAKSKGKRPSSAAAKEAAKKITLDSLDLDL